MNEFLNNIIKTENKHIDSIEEHTKYKIKYVTKYVEEWLYVSTKNNRITNINFIDCMCNTGIYSDGTLGTPVEVLKLFIKFADLNKNKRFNIFLNDININKVKIIKNIVKEFKLSRYSNINVYIEQKDVNDYIESLKIRKKHFASLGKNKLPSTIIFVDPYCFGDIKIKPLIDFVHEYYSELIFNIFNSDYRRNSQNSYIPSKVKKIKTVSFYASNPNDIVVLKKNVKSIYIKAINECYFQNELLKKDCIYTISFDVLDRSSNDGEEYFMSKNEVNRLEDSFDKLSDELKNVVLN